MAVDKAGQATNGSRIEDLTKVRTREGRHERMIGPVAETRVASRGKKTAGLARTLFRSTTSQTPVGTGSTRMLSESTFHTTLAISSEHDLCSSTSRLQMAWSLRTTGSRAISHWLTITLTSLKDLSKKIRTTSLNSSLKLPGKPGSRRKE